MRRLQPPPPPPLQPSAPVVRPPRRLPAAAEEEEEALPGHQKGSGVVQVKLFGAGKRGHRAGVSQPCCRLLLRARVRPPPTMRVTCARGCPAACVREARTRRAYALRQASSLQDAYLAFLLASPAAPRLRPRLRPRPRCGGAWPQASVAGRQSRTRPSCRRPSCCRAAQRPRPLEGASERPWRRPPLRKHPSLFAVSASCLPCTRRGDLR